MRQQLSHYLTSTLPSEEKWVIEMEEYARIEKVPIMDPISIHFLMQLIRMSKPKRILEIGTAIGYSALRMLESQPEASIVTIEKDEARFHLAKNYINNQKKQDQIHVIHGDALEEVEKLAANKERFDFIFIDAAKGQYKQYFELVEPLLIKNGIILSDNVLFKGYVVDASEANSRHEKIANEIRNFNDWLINHSDYSTTIVPIGDGIAISYQTGI